ncbi:unnamed protein product [Hydatigera taeniaeformis]|uniref:LRRCT domain-containing protein n=1 Tax=Hydatigena taeniaeformis TaxID=6205 RepID=A0A0R3WIT4_HYDTA|nr:unnamed protein product [Hydatigera taeniaeformis]
MSLFSLLSTALATALVQSSNSEECPFTCSLSADQELLCSASQHKDFKVEIPCQKDLVNDRIIIGNRSSIRRILPGGLKDLNKLGSEGTLSIFLNMNILELTTTSFAGLEDVLTNLEVLQVGTIHPDTLLKHSKITSLTLDSDRLPELPNDIRGNADIPTFLRLQPQDPSMPIEMNVEVRCHKCVGEKPIEKSTILTFSLHESVKSGGTLDALTMVYMDNCPTLDDALGCPKNNSIDDYIVSVNASNGWKVALEDIEEHDLQTAGGSTRMKPLLLSVIIWCTVLTVLLICLIVALLIRRRVRARKQKEERNTIQHRYSATSLKHIICGTASCEELHRASLSNGGTWVYGTPSQNSCSNLLSETRSQYSFRPPFACLGYPYLRGSVYSGDLPPPGYRSSIPDFLNMMPRNKSCMENGDILLMNGDPGLPPLPTNVGFRMSGTPSYKRSHDGTFKMVQ